MTQQVSTKRFVPVRFKSGKGYGILDTHTKRLVQFRKASPTPQRKAMPPQEESNGGPPDPGGDEKHGLSVLKYLHEVASTLLQEGEQVRMKLDHPGVDKLVEKWLQHQAGWLEDIEAAADKHYSESGAFAPEEEMAAEEGMSAEEGGAPPMESPMEEGPLPNTPGMDSPTPDEAVEGMARANPGEVCPQCGQADCSCGMDMETKALQPGQRVSSEKYDEQGSPTNTFETGTILSGPHGSRGGMRTFLVDYGGGNQAHRKEHELFEPQEGYGKALDPKKIQDAINDSKVWELDKGKMKEAKSFLVELAKDGSSLNDEKRFTAYHLHKAMEDMGVGPDVMEGNADEKEKSLVGVSLFLKKLAFEKAFGFPHRSAAETHAKAMDEFTGEEKELPYTPGEMGEKGRRPEGYGSASEDEDSGYDQNDPGADSSYASEASNAQIRRMKREQMMEDRRRKRDPIEDPEGEKALDELQKSIEEQKKAMATLTQSMSSLLSVH